MATYIKGKEETLAVWDGTSAYEPIVCLTSNTLNENVGEVSAPSTKCDTNNALIREAGQYAYDIAFEGVYAETEASKLSWAEIRTKLRALGTVTWRITTVYDDASTDIEYGEGFFSNLSKSAATEDFISFSGSILGSGDIVAVDPNAT